MAYAQVAIRLLAVVCFLLAAAGLTPYGKNLEALGLALWCFAGTAVPGWKLPG